MKNLINQLMIFNYQLKKNKKKQETLKIYIYNKKIKNHKYKLSLEKSSQILN